MSDLVHDFIFSSAARTPHAEALVHGAERLDYAALAAEVNHDSNFGLGISDFGMKSENRPGAGPEAEPVFNPQSEIPNPKLAAV